MLYNCENKKCIFFNTSELVSPITLTKPHQSELLHRALKASQKNTWTFQRRTFLASFPESEQRNTGHLIMQKTVLICKGKLLLYWVMNEMVPSKQNTALQDWKAKYYAPISFSRQPTLQIECAYSLPVSKGFAKWSKNF